MPAEPTTHVELAIALMQLSTQLPATDDRATIRQAADCLATGHFPPPARHSIAYNGPPINLEAGPLGGSLLEGEHAVRPGSPSATPSDPPSCESPTVATGESAGGASSPRRAVVMTAKIEADTRQDLANHLYNLATKVERGEVGLQSISGGPSSGHVIEVVENDSPTHDEYYAQLRTYLASKASAKQDAAGETGVACDR